MKARIDASGTKDDITAPGKTLSACRRNAQSKIPNSNKAIAALILAT
jgi:hypothetical protein